jgi:selenocysteine-specific elongation factor
LGRIILHTAAINRRPTRTQSPSTSANAKRDCLVELPERSEEIHELKDRIVEVHVQAGFQPPEPNELANHADGNASSLKDIFDVAVAEGYLVKVTDEFFLSAEAEAELCRKVSERLRAGPGLTVAEIRDLLGTTRKYAVPVCEYLDRIGLTRREGDLRVLVIIPPCP